MKYEPQVIEDKWQKKWDEEKAFKVTEDPQKKKYYLSIFVEYFNENCERGVFNDRL